MDRASTVSWIVVRRQRSVIEYKVVSVLVNAAATSAMICQSDEWNVLSIFTSFQSSTFVLEGAESEAADMLVMLSD